MNEIAARTQARRAVHPGDDDGGAETLDLAPQRQPGAHIERVAEGQLHRVDAAGGEDGGAPGVAADHHALLEAGAIEGQHEAGEEGFGAAEFAAGHGLQDTHQGLMPSCSLASPWQRRHSARAAASAASTLRLSIREAVARWSKSGAPTSSS